LAVLFRGVARLAPALALGAVRNALAAALAPAGMARWQTVEAALAALHLVGEGAHDGAVKPGVETSPLGELVEMLLSRWDVVGSNSPRVATHRLVAPALLEICVRYHLAIERRPALLQPALSAFMDTRVSSFLVILVIFGYFWQWFVWAIRVTSCFGNRACSTRTRRLADACVTSSAGS
jgi:exportin-T